MINVAIHSAGYEQGKSTINDIHFHIQSREIGGLIGGNGAGKSTTIQSILQTSAPCWRSGGTEPPHSQRGWLLEPL